MFRFICIALLFSSMPSFAADADFQAEAKKTAATIEALYPASTAKMDAGDFAGANAAILTAFPNANQNAAQAFILGNIFFDVDRKLSYGFHKSAAQLAPDNSKVIWEWALEQHRAGEYAGALASYLIVAKADPNTAENYALQADCLLRLNRIDEAVTAWKKSEDSPNGSLENMEDLVCTVHRDPAPHERRATLLARATQQRDVQAAGDLIVLDCAFPRDWWNAPPHKKYLAHDVPALINALKLPANDLLVRSINCASECSLADQSDAAGIKAILTKHKLLIDADNTLPLHSGLLSTILASAARSKVLDDALRQLIGPKIIKLARAGKDIELWNNAAFTERKGSPEERMKQEREGWEATGDVRFITVILRLKQTSDQLKGADADLAAARKQFPESCLIQRIAFETAFRENKITRELLADAAKAEFTHFSSFMAPATVVDRPRSDYLRSYFARLERLPAAKKPDAPPK